MAAGSATLGALSGHAPVECCLGRVKCDERPSGSRRHVSERGPEVRRAAGAARRQVFESADECGPAVAVVL